MLKYLTFLIVIFLFNVCNAEDSLLTLKQQLDRLQREVNDLSKITYTDSKIKNKEINVATETSNLTAFDLRIYDIEKDIKKLNANFEEIIFQIEDINNLLEDLGLKLSSILSKNNESFQGDKDKDLNNSVTEIGSVSENSLGTIVINSEDLSNNTDISQKKYSENKITNNELSSEEEFQIAYDLIRSQKFKEARIAFQNFINTQKDTKLIGTAHYWLGEIFLLQKEYREAALILAEGYQKFPKSLKAPDMLFKLSQSLILIEKKQDGCNTLKKLIKEFPDNKITNKAKKELDFQECNIFSE